MSSRRPEPPKWIERSLRVGAIVLAVAIVCLSLGPAPQESAVEISDKVIHGLAYFSLTLVVLLAWMGPLGRLVRPFQIAFSATLLIVGGGLLIELVQSLVGRQTEELDALANGLGAGLALGLWRVVLSRSPRAFYWPAGSRLSGNARGRRTR